MKSYMFRIAFTIIGLVICIGLIYLGNTVSLNGTDEDCYDRFSNKIIGQECIKENGYDTRRAAQITNSGLGIAILVLLFILGGTLDLMDNLTNRRSTL